MKIKVTDEMIDKALEAYFPREDHLDDFDYEGEILNDEFVRPSMNAALVAVFNHIADDRKMVESTNNVQCNELEEKILIKKFGMVRLDRDPEKFSFEEFEVDCQGNDVSYNEIAVFLEKATLKEINRRAAKKRLQEQNT